MSAPNTLLPPTAEYQLDSQSFAPAVSFDPDLVETLIDPRCNAHEKFVLLKEIITNPAPQHTDFLWYAAQPEINVTRDNFANGSLNEEGLSTYSRLVQAGITYAIVQSDLDKKFADEEFERSIEDETWKSLENAPIIERKYMVDGLYDRYRTLDDCRRKFETDPEFMRYVSKHATTAEAIALRTEPVHDVCDLYTELHSEYTEKVLVKKQAEQAQAEALAKVRAQTEARAAARAQAQEQALEQAAKAEARFKEVAEAKVLEQERIKKLEEAESVRLAALKLEAQKQAEQAKQQSTSSSTKQSTDYIDWTDVSSETVKPKSSKPIDLSTIFEPVQFTKVERAPKPSKPTTQKTVETPESKPSKLSVNLDSAGDYHKFRIDFGIKKASTTSREANEVIKDVGDRTAITSELIKDDIAGISKAGKKKLGALVITTFLALGTSKINTDSNSGPTGIFKEHNTDDTDGSFLPVSLAPNHPNPAAEVSSASRKAKERYDLEPNETVPSKLKTKVAGLGINTARIKVRTISANKKLQAAEPNKTEMDRSDPIVRKVDAMARYTMWRMRGDPTLKTTEIDTAEAGAVKVMMTSRFPTYVHKLAPDFDAETKFQRKVSNTIRHTVFRGNTPYSEKQETFMANLIAQTVDKTTSKKREAHALAGITKTAEQISGHSKEIRVTNPRYSVAEFAAAISTLESGIPSDPTIKNKWGYTGWLQMSPEYWHKPGVGWAETYLGNSKAPMNTDNTVMVGIKMLADISGRLGSIEATEAEWLKGPSMGTAIAGSNRNAYNRALRQFDGNNTTIKQYHHKINSKLPKINVHEQLPFLKGVMERNPDFDWSLLDKEVPLYSQIHMNKLRSQAVRRANKAEQRVERRIAGSDIRAIAMREFKKNGNKKLETLGPNTGPEVQKYTGGRKGVNAPWCAWFVSYVYREAGYKFEDGPAWTDGSIPAVENLVSWFKEYGMHFTPSSKELSPQVGDVIMYGRGQHTGVVVEVNGDMIVTIEGNTSGDGSFNADGGTVGRKKINIKTYPMRLDFGRLKDPSR